MASEGRNKMNIILETKNYKIVDDNYGNKWYTLLKHRSNCDEGSWNYYGDEWAPIEDAPYNKDGLIRLFRLFVKDIKR